MSPAEHVSRVHTFPPSSMWRLYSAVRSNFCRSSRRGRAGNATRGAVVRQLRRTSAGAELNSRRPARRREAMLGVHARKWTFFLWSSGQSMGRGARSSGQSMERSHAWCARERRSTFTSMVLSYAGAAGQSSPRTGQLRSIEVGTDTTTRYDDSCNSLYAARSIQPGQRSQARLRLVGPRNVKVRVQTPRGDEDGR